MVAVHFFTYSVDLSLTSAEYWVGRCGSFASQASGIIGDDKVMDGFPWTSSAKL
jgi:hypothetical protein